MGFLLESITREQIKGSLSLREFLTMKKTIEFILLRHLFFFFFECIMKPNFLLLDFELLARELFFPTWVISKI